MPRVVEIDSAADVEQARDDFLAELEAQKAKFSGTYNAYQQMAIDFAQGVTLVFGNRMLRSKQQFFKLLNDRDEVIGLLRVKIQTDSIHIDQVTALGGGKFLVERAKQIAINLQKDEVNLSTADEGLPSYYAHLGFEMTSKGAKTGEMHWKVPPLGH